MVIIMTELKILSGRDMIGGNFIKIVDKDHVLILDQGMRFDIFGKYFSNSIQPLGIMELRRMNVLPKEEWYKDAEDIYITHLHLDHLGALSNIPSDIDVHLPGGSIYSEMKKKWENSPTWSNIIPENYYLKINEVSPLVEDDNRVLPIQVLHSAYPSVAYLYFGNKKTILYSGDLRIHTFFDDKEFNSIYKGSTLIDYLKEYDLNIDILLLEGTNFGSNRMPILPESAISIMEKIMLTSDLVIVTSHHLDAELLIAVLKLARRNELRSYTSSEIVAKILQICDLNFDLKILEEFSKNPIFPTKPLNEVLENRSLIISSHYEIIDLCRDIGQERLHKTRTVCILTESESEIEEMLESKVIKRWLSIYGIQVYTLRVSGHYYPFELEEILKNIKVKEIIPIHTAHPEMMINFADFYKNSINKRSI